MTVNQPGAQYPYEHYEPHDAQAALRNQITRTRSDLGDTIQELAARADVKARAKEMVSDVRARAKDVVRTRARQAKARTQDVASSSASTVRKGLSQRNRGPARIVVGAGAGALAGWGVFELVRRRRAARRGRRLAWSGR